MLLLNKGKAQRSCFPTLAHFFAKALQELGPPKGLQELTKKKSAGINT
jgi:hypothetical protein